MMVMVKHFMLSGSKEVPRHGIPSGTYANCHRVKAATEPVRPEMIDHFSRIRASRLVGQWSSWVDIVGLSRTAS